MEFPYVLICNSPHWNCVDRSHMWGASHALVSEARVWKTDFIYLPTDEGYSKTPRWFNYSRLLKSIL